MKQASLGVLLLMAALLMACSSEDKAQPEAVSREQPKTWKLCVQANKIDSTTTRGLYLDGSVLKSKWGDPSTSTGQTVEVWRGDSHLGNLTASASNNGSTVITGELTGTFTNDETLTLYSPSKARDYSGQTGTIESMSAKDYVSAEITVTAVDGSSGVLATSEAAFERRQSFNKITLSEAVTPLKIDATGLIASSTAADVVTTGSLTVSAASATNTYYVAMANTESTAQTYNFSSGFNAGVAKATIQNGYYYAPTISITRDIKMNPLWYVAEYNMINTSIGPSATPTMGSSTEASYLYAWEDAMSTFAAQTDSYDDYKNAGKTINGVNYHLPVDGEWLSIMPSENVGNNIKDYVTDETRTNYKPAYITPKFGYNNVTKAGVVESSYFIYAYNSGQELHAIRFLGTPYCSAWRWVWNGAYLTVYATLIDVIEAKETVAANWYNANWGDVAWGNDESHFAVMRSFYGYGTGTTGTGGVVTHYSNNAGLFWSTTENTTYPEYSNCMDFHIGYGCINIRPKTVGLTVRLFRDN